MELVEDLCNNNSIKLDIYYLFKYRFISPKAIYEVSMSKEENIYTQNNNNNKHLQT